MTELPPNEFVERSYRLRRYYLILGIACTTFFLVMGVGSTVAAYWNIDGSFPRPAMAATIFGTFWSCWILVGLYLILCHFRHSLKVSNAEIRVVGCFSTKTILHSGVIQITWRTVPRSGSVIVRGSTKKIKIEFENYSTDQRNELIAFLHDRFSESQQKGWPRFAQRFLESNPKQMRTHRVATTVSIAALTGFAFAFVYCWAIGLGVYCLITGVLNALLALWYVRSVRIRRNQESPEASAKS